MKKLFSIIVPAKRLNSHFIKFSNMPEYEPARLVVEEIFENFPDVDGNFIEQFQSSGFDARIFELFLFAYFASSGFDILREHNRPDFLLEKDGLRIAVEATTVNPTQGVEYEERLLHQITPIELEQKQRHELPIKFGSALYSKLQKKYWELEHCKDIPIILAIEDFHERSSLFYSHAALGSYLYGLAQKGTKDSDGRLLISHEQIENHIGKKIIPSNFFAQPDTENISAVLFCNGGTLPKFNRMGMQVGYHRGNILMTRTGVCYRYDYNSSEPDSFSYDVSALSDLEEWGQELTLIHNPNAKYPIPQEKFENIVQEFLENNASVAYYPYFGYFNPLSSFTSIALVDGDFPEPIELSKSTVGSILKSEFDTYVQVRSPLAEAYVRELEWYSDRNRNIVGTVVQDNTDNDFAYVILGKDEDFVFKAIDYKTDIEARKRARNLLLNAMKRIHLSGCQIFPQK